MPDFKDRVRGCLIGGAAGDALGYAVEFVGYDGIQKRYGAEGIQEYELDFESGTAIISDDTQMTLFTANGLLLAEGNPGRRPLEGWVYTAYLDWLLTQSRTKLAEKRCWLQEIPELNARRAPGGTCLHALQSGEMGSVDEPINNSKGCGGVMRVAPAAVYGHLKGWAADRSAKLGAEAAAITHGHPFGWLSAAALVGIVYRILNGASPEAAVLESMEAMPSLYPDSPWAKELVEGMRKAVALTCNAKPDAENIHALGGGWVGEEALYIAIYCAVKYAGDFDRCMIASVNHSGDSDSTGAIAGNILGAYCGYEAIGEKWKRRLELKDVILEIADDLCAIGADRGEAWMKKYAAAGNCRGNSL